MNKFILFFLIPLLIAGCGGSVSFTRYEGTDIEDAFEKLAKQRESIESFKSNINLSIKLPQGEYQSSGKLVYIKDGGTTIVVSGPLGITLASIHVANDYAEVEVPAKGIIKRLSYADKDPLPGTDISPETLESVRYLLLPTLSISNKDSWRIQKGTYGNPGNISLSSAASNTDQSAEIELDFNPIRLLSEIYSSSNDELIEKTVSYDGIDASIPKSLAITYKEYNLEIIYKLIDLDIRDSEV